MSLFGMFKRPCAICRRSNGEVHKVFNRGSLEMVGYHEDCLKKAFSKPNLVSQYSLDIAILIGDCLKDKKERDEVRLKKAKMYCESLFSEVCDGED